MMIAAIFGTKHIIVYVVVLIAIIGVVAMMRRGSA